MQPQQYQRGKTIAALASPPGQGAIHVLRMSGPQAIAIAEKIFSGPVKEYRSHTAHTGQIRAADGSPIDQVLLLIFRAPRSYTGEETVEIQCHGSSLIARKILERMIEAGAQPALPGEFTFQAFQNGKLDLAQAEAVQLLIAAKNDLARESASHQLGGALSHLIGQFQQELTRVAAILEALIDFPEEGIEFGADKIAITLDAIGERMHRLLETFHDGKVMHEGLTLTILGAPNVGKSSLMNALLGRNRAIVTDIPGTTRDSLEEEMRLGGMHFRLIDTAGIRESADPIEQEGVRRSHAALTAADLVLLVLDASRPLSDNDRALLTEIPQGKTILVWNKIDLSRPAESLEQEPTVFISAKMGRGLETLIAAIEQMIWKKELPSKEEVVLTSMRHYQALTLAAASCNKTAAGIRADLSPELSAIDMRDCLHHLGTILGTNVTEDILTSIFSQFCVGK